MVIRRRRNRFNIMLDIFPERSLELDSGTLQRMRRALPALSAVRASAWDAVDLRRAAMKLGFHIRIGRNQMDRKGARREGGDRHAPAVWIKLPRQARARGHRVQQCLKPAMMVDIKGARRG